MGQAGLLQAIDLAEALRLRDFEVHYQRIVRLPDLEVVGVEALVRWRHPSRGLLYPADFLPAAEAGGLLPAIDAEVRALTAAVSGRLPGDVYLNTSAADLVDGGQHLIAALRPLGLERIVLELSEADDGIGVDELARAVRCAQAMGVRVALDDFGAAGASLRRLRALPVDIVKLDMELIAGLTTEPERGWAVVDAVVHLARSLGAQVVAEGVEDDEQLAALIELDCPMAQGFLLHEPHPFAP